ADRTRRQPRYLHRPIAGRLAVARVKAPAVNVARRRHAAGAQIPCEDGSERRASHGPRWHERVDREAARCCTERATLIGAETIRDACDVERADVHVARGDITPRAWPRRER